MRNPSLANKYSTCCKSDEIRLPGLLSIPPPTHPACSSSVREMITLLSAHAQSLPSLSTRTFPYAQCALGILDLIPGAHNFSRVFLVLVLPKLSLQLLDTRKDFLLVIGNKKRARPRGKGRKEIEISSMVP